MIAQVDILGCSPVLLLLVHYYSAIAAKFSSPHWYIFTPLFKHDMSGDVWEWTCLNWGDHSDDSVQRCNDDTTDAQFRVVRGSSLRNDTVNMRSSARSYFYQVNGSDFIGSRVLCEIPSNNGVLAH